MLPLLPKLRPLRAVVAAAASGSVSGAARALHLSQPAVTQAIASLERDLGVPLFIRSSAGVEPTPAGHLLLGRARRMLDQLSSGLDDSAMARDGGERRGPRDPLRSITMTQLCALTVVVEASSFAAAARASGGSRAALHRAARELESASGLSLFERTSFGLRPTRAAAELARRVRLAAAEYAQARDEIGARRSDVSAGTVIGAMPLSRVWLVPRAVLEFSSRWPDHAISIFDGPYETLLAALRRGAADLLVGALRDPLTESDVVQEHLFDDPLGIVMRAGHPLAARRRLTARDLAAHPWIAPHAGSPLRQRFNELFERSGVDPPAHAIECNSLVAARELLIGSDRLMLLSAHQVRHEVDMKLLRVLPHPHGRLTRAIGLTVRRDWQPTERQRALLELLRAAARRI